MCFRNFGWMLSGPGDLLGLRFDNTFSKSKSETLHVKSWFLITPSYTNSGTSLMSSSVKTELKKLFITLHFSSSLDVNSPLSLIRSAYHLF